MTVQVRCWPAAMLPKQSPLSITLKTDPPASMSPTAKGPGCNVTRAPFPIAEPHGMNIVGIFIC
jgi:hypothetical protein